MKYHVIAAALLGGLLSMGSANAATLTFSGETGTGYTLAEARIVNGNCDVKGCLALNDNEATTITAENGGTFSVSSFWFQLLGKGTGNSLTLTTDLGSRTFAQPAYKANKGYTISDLGSLFSDISFLTFSTGGGGNVRVDTVALSDPSIAPVPLPASGLLLLAGIGGLAAARRRKPA